MAPESVQVTLVRLEGKVDALAAVLAERQIATDAKIANLETSRSRLIGAVVSIFVALAIGTIGAIGGLHV